MHEEGIQISRGHAQNGDDFFVWARIDAQHGTNTHPLHRLKHYWLQPREGNTTRQLCLLQNLVSGRNVDGKSVQRNVVVWVGRVRIRVVLIRHYCRLCLGVCLQL